MKKIKNNPVAWYFLFLLLSLMVGTGMFSSCQKNQPKESLDVDVTTMNFDFKGGQQTFLLQTFSEWSITITQPWCSTNFIRGSASQNIIVTVSSNLTPSMREASVIIRSGSKEHTITVTQQPNTDAIEENVRIVKDLVKSNPNIKYPNEVIITGDGYSWNECTSGGKFDTDVQNAVKAFFSEEPYRSYEDYFKVYSVRIPSAESGITQTDKKITRNTVFGVRFTGNSQIQLPKAETNEELSEVIMKVGNLMGRTRAEMSNVLIIIMCNINRYGGICYMISDGAAVALCPTSETSEYRYANFSDLIHHEANGHGFGRLCDEYITHKNSGLPTDGDFSTSSFKQWENLGYYPNTDISGDRNTAKWKHFYDLAGYSVNYMEGSYYYAQGAWRPEKVSVMNDNRPYFNAPAREHIVKLLLRRAAGVPLTETDIPNDPFDFNQFVAKDVVKSMPADMRNAVEKPLPAAPPLPHPVMVGF